MLADLLEFEWQQILAGPPQHPRRSFRSTARMYAGMLLRINTSGLSPPVLAQNPLLLSHCAAPAPLPLPDSFHSAPACTRTEALLRRSPLRNEPLVATWPVATMVEKSFW